MLRCLFLALVILLITGQLAADTLLWDNGDPDWRATIGAPTEPEDMEPNEFCLSPGFSQTADDFQNDAPWTITKLSLQGLFGSIKEQEDLDLVRGSERIEVKIYSPHDEGGPGRVVWSLKLEGAAAKSAQTFLGHTALDLEAFSDHTWMANSTSRGKLVQIEVSNPDGLVTLPPGKWFVSWRVLRAPYETRPEGGIAFAFFSSPYPLPGFEGDATYYGRSLPYSFVEARGERPHARWSHPVFQEHMKYNLSFRIYGEKQ